MKTTQNKRMANVAMSHFGSWRQSLRAAGVEPVSWKKWSPQRVLEEIRAWHARGAIIQSDLPEYRKLLAAARARFGSWHHALIAAGKGSMTLPKWNKDRVLEAIRYRQQHGLSLKATWREDISLYSSAKRYFGSWRGAVHAAGHSDALSRRWSRQGVLDAIRMRYESGLPMSPIDDIAPSLYSGASRLFGGWHKALLAAGLPSKVPRRWSRQTVIDTILARYAAALPLASIRTHDPGVYLAARRYIGSWQAAILTAGVPVYVREQGPWPTGRCPKVLWHLAKCASNRWNRPE